MKRAAVSIGRFVSLVAGGVGLEGAFLVAGTALLAVGSTFIVPYGPWFVVGGMAILAGIALALPAGRR